MNWWSHCGSLTNNSYALRLICVAWIGQLGARSCLIGPIEALFVVHTRSASQQTRYLIVRNQSHIAQCRSTSTTMAENGAPCGMPCPWPLQTPEQISPRETPDTIIIPTAFNYYSVQMICITTVRFHHNRVRYKTRKPAVHCFEIWQASRRHYRRDACQILVEMSTLASDLETLLDLTIGTLLNFHFIPFQYIRIVP